MTNENIHTSVDLWLSDPDTATIDYGPIAIWDTSAVTDMSELFRYATLFNDDISSWDVSSVTTMYRMFFGCNAFNCDVSSWDVSQVTTMEDMFCDDEGLEEASSSPTPP